MDNKNNDNFKMLFEQAPLGYQSLDIDGNFIEINQKWLDTFGYEREEVIGKWFGDFLTPPYQDGFRERFPIFKAQGHIHSEFEMVHKNGDILFIAFEGKIGYDEAGNFKQTHCILEDITEKKKLTDSLAKSEEKYRQLVNNAMETIVVAQDGFIKFANPIALSLLEVDSEDELIDKPLIKFIHPEDAKMVGENYQKRISDEEVDNDYEFRLLTKNGNVIWAEIHASLFEWEGKRATLNFITDVTLRKQAENELRESEERFKALHNASFGGIAIHDKGIILECNLGLSKMTGYSLDELIGMDGLLLIAPDSRELVLSNIMAGSEKPYESFGLRKNGEIYSIMLEARNVHYKGKSVRTVEFRDITESKKAEETIKKRIDELESFQKLVVDRELKMIELKKEINELLKKLGQDPKY